MFATSYLQIPEAYQQPIKITYFRYKKLVKRKFSFSLTENSLKMMLCILIFVTFILIFLYHYFTRNYNYWKNQGIPSPEKCFPLLGNMWKVIFTQESFITFCEKLYQKGCNQSMIGFYQITTPTLLIRDPELVKKVLVTNFSSFGKNPVQLHKELDPLLMKNPFFSQGDSWKEGRISLTNLFSSRKLKSMFSLICEVSFKFDKYLNEKIRTENGVVEFQLKELFAKYTGEIVTTVGMGVEGKCFERNPKTFGKIVSSVFHKPAFMGGFTQVAVFFLPRLAKFFKFGLVSREMDVFFRKSVKEVVKGKKQEGGVQNDFLHFAMENEKSNEINEKLDNLTANVLSFIVDAKETTSATLNFLTFQLASHPEVQEKVRNEINSVLLKYNGKWEYEALKDLTYLEQVIYESMRLFPTLGNMMKICTKKTQLVGFDGLSCRVLPGDIVGFSIHGLHKDPKYWPDPEKFDPERFIEERKKDIDKFVFLPFSEGPRMCLGMRLAKMIMKMSIISILKNYSLAVSPKTRIPMKQELRNNFLTEVEGGLWVFVKALPENS